MNIQEAKDYIEYGIRKFGLDEEIMVGLTDEEIIKLADSIDSRADAAYESWKERDI